MRSASARRIHEAWLRELTSLPTAAGLEGRVISWIERWVARRRRLVLKRDRAGNLVVTQARQQHTAAKSRPGARRPPPLFITAHLDHPAFVVLRVNGSHVDLEFRGGVHDPYFNAASIEIFDASGRAHRARIVSLDPAALPFKRVTARLDRTAPAARRRVPEGLSIQPGDIGRWVFPGERVLPRIQGGMLRTHACDDLAGAAAALAAMDVLSRRAGTSHVGLLFTRAEEVGFIGAIAACQAGSVPARARLMCLETSRSFADSPIGGGPILRVGDKTSVFAPELTNALGLLMTDHEKTAPGFTWQRKLMPGGTCEATTFSTYGYQATCLCLALGNYHNMTDIDGVAAGKRPAKVGPEIISVKDFHGLVEMLVVCATRLDSRTRPSLVERMERLMNDRGHVLRAT